MIIEDIKLSVCVVTYNQEQYIAECLQSLVDQETNFKFEIIVGEDCSTDNTREIIQQYIAKYPDVIKPIFHIENVGAVENVKQVYKKAKGKYIAHMDGDDIALPYKLQLQADILEKNNNISICSHDVKRIDAKSTVLVKNWVYNDGEYDLLNFFEKLPFFAHSSKMFRNDFPDKFWDELLNEKNLLDIDIHFESAKRGRIYHIGRNLGAYRVNVGMSLINKKINPIVPQGLERVFNKGIKYYEGSPEKISLLKQYYSHACIKCAFEFALFNQDEKMFRYYIFKSIKLSKKIDFNKLVFLIGAFFPKLFFCSLQIRKLIKHLGNRNN